LVFTKGAKSQQLKGTHDWAQYRIELPINPAAQKIWFGVLVAGTGTLWADDLELLVDGKPIAEAPWMPPRLADPEFDSGSRIVLNSLTLTQISNLVTLARVSEPYWIYLRSPTTAGWCCGNQLIGPKAADLPTYFEKAKNTKGIVVDIRNYPSEFMPFAMGAYLATHPTPFVAFTFPDLANPGAFHFGDGPMINPGPVHYGGRVAILVDETSQSQAEYTAMALRAMPNAIVVGSTTAGADGDISLIRLPGQLSTLISGLGVFYPDHRPTQRVGIVPDIVVKPTVQGIAAGRDEVLETAVHLIEDSK
jgi:Peptidase family S41